MSDEILDEEEQEYSGNWSGIAKNIKEKLSEILFDLITDVPESLLTKAENPEERVEKLIQSACLKSATVSGTLSIPAGITGILTSIPDIAAIWRIQAQLVADIAATYGKMALLSRETMVWCLFRHSAASLLRDIAVRTGTRIVVQKVSITVLHKILHKIGIKISAKVFGRIALRAIPAIGAIGNGAYTYLDTREVGKTAEDYFHALADMDKEAVK
ncbi:MAG: EcsC family protein [Fibrobacteraceae bacterium]|nr:EcsC family protein [Fibrobacteraceae bacterium]MCF0216599.1 EcsC family protein [Fibrobacteraceae bacterium]